MVGEGGGSVQSHAPSRTAEAVLRRSFLGRSSIIDTALRREPRTTAGHDVPARRCRPAARGARGRRLLPAAWFPFRWRASIDWSGRSPRRAPRSVGL